MAVSKCWVQYQDPQTRRVKVGVCVGSLYGRNLDVCFLERLGQTGMWVLAKEVVEIENRVRMSKTIEDYGFSACSPSHYTQGLHLMTDEGNPSPTWMHAKATAQGISTPEYIHRELLGRSF